MRINLGSGATRRPPSSSASSPAGPDPDGDFARVCYPLYSGKPGWAEESRLWQARTIKNMDVSAHYSSHEVASFDPWSVLDAVRCPVLILADEDDPISPLPVV